MVFFLRPNEIWGRQASEHALNDALADYILGGKRSTAQVAPPQKSLEKSLAFVKDHIPFPCFVWFCVLVPSIWGFVSFTYQMYGSMEYSEKAESILISQTLHYLGWIKPTHQTPKAGWTNWINSIPMIFLKKKWCLKRSPWNCICLRPSFCYYCSGRM